MKRAHVAIAGWMTATLCAFLLAVHGLALAAIASRGHPDPFATDCARALPLLAASVLLALAWRQVRNPIRRRWVAWRGEHLVIGGDDGLAARIAVAERRKRRPVMLWVDDPGAPWVARLAGRGIAHAATGGARAGTASLGLDRAAALLLVGPDDGRTIALAAAAIDEARIGRPPGDPLPIIASVEDADLRRGLEEGHAREGDRRSARLRVVSLANVAARSLFLDHPLDRFQPIETGSRLVLSFGFDPAIEAYVLRLLAGAHYRDGRKPRIVILDPDAASREAAFRARRPGASQLAPVLFEQAAIDRPGLLPGLLAEATARHGEPSMILVGLGNDADALDCARATNGWYRDADRPPPPIHVRTAPIDEDRLDCSIHPFGAATAIADSEPLLQDPHDTLVRAIHEAYLDSRLDAGITIGAWRSMEEWDDLAESFRDDNRLVADCYQLKLRDIGARTARAGDAGFRLDPVEIEDLARAEHDRWMAAKLIDGWRYGEARDDGLRHHPDILPYDELSEPVRELDRDQIRLMTRLLPLSGQTLRRVLPVRVAEGIGALTPDDLFARLARLYPDREPMLIGRLDQPAVRALLVRARAAGRRVQLLLLAHPDNLLDTLAQAERIAVRRLIRDADAIFAAPAGTGEADLEPWWRSHADRVVTVAEDGRLAAPWLA